MSGKKEVISGVLFLAGTTLGVFLLLLVSLLRTIL